MADTRWRRSVKTWSREGAPRNNFLTSFYLQISQFPYSLGTYMSTVICSSTLTLLTTFSLFHITLSAFILQSHYNHEAAFTLPCTHPLNVLKSKELFPLKNPQVHLSELLFLYLITTYSSPNELAQQEVYCPSSWLRNNRSLPCQHRSSENWSALYLLSNLLAYLS